MLFNKDVKTIIYKVALAALAASYLAVLGFIMKGFSVRGFIMVISLSISLALVYGNYQTHKRDTSNEEAIGGNSSKI